jgi:putative transcription factor
MEGECEVCGRPVRSLIQVNIEGSVVRTCSSCSRLGTRLPKIKPRRRVHPQAMSKRRKESVLEPRPGYGDMLRERREELGLTQEELGKRLQEKTSVVARLEAERMTPSEALAKKIERHLGIKVMEKVEEQKEGRYRAEGQVLTLGDVVKIKRTRS